MSGRNKFPTPTPTDLSEEPLYALNLNSYWWAIVQGELRHIDRAYRWENYTPEIEGLVQQLFIRQEIGSGGSTMPVLRGAKVSRSNLQAVSSNASTLIHWPDVTWDTDNFTGADVTRLFMPFTGKYEFKLSVAFQANSTGRRLLRLFKTGNILIAEKNEAAPSVGTAIPTLVSQAELSAGDWIEAYVLQNSGVNLDIQGGAYQTFITVNYLGE